MSGTSILCSRYLIRTKPFFINLQKDVSLQEYRSLITRTNNPKTNRPKFYEFWKKPPYTKVQKCMILYQFAVIIALYDYWCYTRSPFRGMDTPQILVLDAFGSLNIFPIVRIIYRILPDYIRKRLMIMSNAPDLSCPIQDLYDCKRENPYQVEEVLQDKVWRVGY